MATIKDIAKYAGVSPSTVSIVLNGQADERKISETTQQRVWEAVRALEYRPNISARRLRGDSQSNTLVIAVFWASDFRAHMVSRFLKGLQNEILQSNRDCEIIIHPYKNNELHKITSLRSMNMYNAAIICNASAKDLEYLEESNFHIPIILYNRHSQKFCTVNVDDVKIGSIPAEVFASRGHRKAAIITSPPAFSGMDVRINSFMSTAAKHNLEIVDVIYEDNSMPGGYSGAKRLLELEQRPDCLFCASDAMAIGALRRLHKAGIIIPDHLELISVGNGDRDLEEYATTSLSVVHIPMEKMAEACLRLVFDVLNHKIEPPHSIELPIHYIARESCGEMKKNIG